VLVPLGANLEAQAPAAADLWRVTATSLTAPAALQTSTIGVFWNPAPSPTPGGLSLGLAMTQTPDVLGLSGFMGGAGYTPWDPLQMGVIVGLMQVRDLVRTTTSPNSEDGSIPVHELVVGANLGARTPLVQAGVLVLLHDQRFDVLQETGWTLDAGVRVTPHPRVRLAGATHFLPVDFSRQATTDYYLGIEYVAADSLPVAGTVARIVVSYGSTYRGSGDWEHTLAGGLRVGQAVHISSALTSESAYGQRSLRIGLGVALFIGRYGIDAALGSGLNDIGPTYRVGIDAQLLQ
jgi:hypothetical protein